MIYGVNWVQWAKLDDSEIVFPTITFYYKMVDQSITILRIVKFVQSPCESLLIPRFNTNYPPVMVVNSIRKPKFDSLRGLVSSNS